MECRRFDRWLQVAVVLLSVASCSVVTSRAFCAGTMREGHDAESRERRDYGDGKIHRDLMQGQLRDSRPKLELVAVAMTTMAQVATSATFAENERRRPDLDSSTDSSRTISPPIDPRDWNPSKLRTCSIVISSANSIEINTQHSCYSFRDRAARCSRAVPFPFSLWERERPS